MCVAYPLSDRCEDRTLMTTGAIFTAKPGGLTVNTDICAHKADVYPTGSPQNTNSAGLTKGIYHFQVTDPSLAAIDRHAPRRKKARWSGFRRARKPILPGIRPKLCLILQL